MIETLSADQALEKWKKGVDEWNRWADSTSRIDIEFCEVDFSRHVLPGAEVSFNGYRFPKGNVSFKGAKFGRMKVDFTNAEFGGGDVCFDGAVFGAPDDDKSVRIESNRKPKHLFNEVKFAKKCKEDSDGKCNLSFRGAVFYGCELNFTGSLFAEGTVDFSEVLFNEDAVIFSDVWFDACELKFNNSHWVGRMLFSPGEASLCKTLDFSSSKFEGELSFLKLKTNAVIDLRHSRLSHPIDLNSIDIDFELAKEKVFGVFSQAKNPDASTCFRRLKKLAKESDDHQRALDFFAKEIKSSYWYDLKGWKLLLYYGYEFTSNFGRSFRLPFLWLTLFTLLFSCFYNAMSDHDNWAAAISFSLGHALPVYAGSRTARNSATEILFCGPVPDCVLWMTLIQGVLSGAFLFLLALAFRNLFRS